MNLNDGLGAVRWGMRPDEVLAALPGSEKSAGFVGRDPKTGDTWTAEPGVSSQYFTPAPEGVALHAHFRFEHDALCEISLSPQLPVEPPPSPPPAPTTGFFQSLFGKPAPPQVDPAALAWWRAHLLEPAHGIARWLGAEPGPDADRLEWHRDGVHLALEVEADDASIRLVRPRYRTSVGT